MSINDVRHTVPQSASILFFREISGGVRGLELKDEHYIGVDLYILGILKFEFENIIENQLLWMLPEGVETNQSHLFDIVVSIV